MVRSDPISASVSTNATKIIGLYRRKGALAIGSDADIVLLDTTPRHADSSKADMHEADYSLQEDSGLPPAGQA